MNTDVTHPGEGEAIEREAALWVLRRDRGLSPSEQDEFAQWLAADPRHGKAIAQLRWGWEELDRLAGLQSSVHAIPDPDLLALRSAGPGARRRLRWFLPLAAAAAVILGLILGRYPWSAPPLATQASSRALMALCEERALADGSAVQLNRGAALTVEFSPGERRVRLERGEASFKVTKDSARPFVVSVAGVEVRAVGTAFDVRLEQKRVEVVVKEGHVRVAPPGKAADETLIPTIGPGEAEVIALGPEAPPPHIVRMSQADLEARLAWQPRLLDFTNVPLGDIAAEFNHHNPLRLVIDDPALRAFPLSASFRSDNMDGFVRLMESQFGMGAERRGESEIILRKLK